MLDITNHAIERYIQRVLQLELNDEEMADMLAEMGVDITKTITAMVQNADLINTNKRKTYLLYRDTVIIMQGNRVVTLYRLETIYKDINKHVQHICQSRDHLKTLIRKSEELRFKREVSKTMKDELAKYISKIADLLLTSGKIMQIKHY